MANERTSRMSLTVPVQTKKVIDRLAEQYGISSSAYLQMLAERGLAIEAIIEAGGEVIAKSTDGREILLASKSLELRSSPYTFNKKLLNGHEE